MNELLVQRIRDAGTAGSTDTLAKASAALVEAAGTALTVRGARDTFSKVLNRARGGEVQVIGAIPEEMAVVMSVKDLVGVVQEAARPRSLGDALAALGFSNPSGQRLTTRRGRPRNKLRMAVKESGPTSSL